MKYQIPVGESREYETQGRYIFIKEASGLVGLNVTTADGRKSSYDVEKNDQIDFPERIKRVKLTNLSGALLIVEALEGEGIFHPNRDETTVVISGSTATLPVAVEAIGATNNTAATDDTGTWTLIALTKRLLSKLPGLGQKTMAESGSVVLASDHPAVQVAFANTGKTIGRWVCTASLNKTVVKASPGILYGWIAHNFQVTTTSEINVKIYDKATAPNEAIDVPVISFPVSGEACQIAFSAGVKFNNGIVFLITGAGGAQDNTTTPTIAGNGALSLIYE